jgi:hypothetical protein
VRQLWALAAALPISQSATYELLSCMTKLERASLVLRVLRHLGTGRETLVVLGRLQERAEASGGSCAVA